MRCLFPIVLACLLMAGEPIPAIAGNTVLQDIAARIGGDRFAVACFGRPGVSPHGYQPVPEDVRRLAAARLVIINGLGFEGWFEGLAREARFAGAVVVASAGIVPLTMCSGHDHGHDHDHGHGADVPDPHAWQSIRHGVRYAENIRDALIAADPTGAADIRARADAYVAELRRADAWASATLAVIPRAQRKIITGHDALAYFARDYGFEVLAPDSASGGGQPGAKAVAALVEFIRRQGVKGVFLEAGGNPKLIEQIAAEAGVRVGGSLLLDTVPAEGGYLGMFRANVEAIAAALR